MANLRLLLLLLCLTAFRPAHPLKMCVCDAKYQAEKGLFSLKFKFFWDDLEAVLEKQTGQELSLTSLSPENDRLVTAFIQRQFDLKINQLPIQIQFTRSSIQDVVLILEFEGKGFRPADAYAIDLTNKILLDVFPDQYNLVRFDLFGDGNLETMRFERNERQLTKMVVRH